MKVYQCIHKYPNYIEQFEKKFSVKDRKNLTFNQLQSLILEDGYASTYVLKPALDGDYNEVFFTIWDYERLQYLWAEENGLTTRDLNLIKQKQIEWFKPDVFYNHSAFRDNEFIHNYFIEQNIIKVCWNGIILDEPESFTGYDIHVSLHRPYISKWKNKGLKAFELQPAFTKAWKKYDVKPKLDDLIFYGQSSNIFFKNRNDLLDQILLQYTDEKVNIHTEYRTNKKPYVNLPLLWRFGRYVNGKHKHILKKAKEPLYGQNLYEAIGKTKYTLNGYTNYNKNFKSNMRLFEAIGCGSIVISEEGNYPEGFEPNKNYISYKNHSELLRKLKDLFIDYDNIKEKMDNNINQLKELYSKQNQWDTFRKSIENLS